jgi:hypothetical protein
MRIIHFLSDLARSQALQEDFTRNPEETMQRAGLDGDEQRLFLSSDRSGVLTAIGHELHKPFTLMMPTPWPGSGNPSFASITPSSGRRGTSVSATTKLSIAAPAARALAGAKSQSSSSVDTVLQQGSYTIRGKTQRVRFPIESDPYAVIEAVYDIPSDAPTGPYQVVTTYNMSPNSGTVPSPTDAFHVTA